MITENIIHVATIDLLAPGVKPWVTPLIMSEETSNLETSHISVEPVASAVDLCFQENRRVNIAVNGACPLDTVQAIAGRDVLVDQGQVLAQFSNQAGDTPYSRVAMGIDVSGEILWIVVIDGKQPLYSEGVTLDELALLVQDLGVHRAIAVDGSGSSTLVMDTETGTLVLNAPTHTKWPMRERPVANHLGFYALPVKL